MSERSWRSENSTNDKLITDDEKTVEEDTDMGGRSVLKQKQRPVPGQDHKSRDRRGRTVAQVGDQCVLLVGTTRQDVGRQGQVTEMMPVMMGIEYREGHGNKLVVKNKRPSSVLMLEEGLVVVRDRKGTLWVRRSDTTWE